MITPRHAMDLSIIITSWNTRTILHECLDSILRFSPQRSFEVIVVDNGSGDGSADMVAGEFPSVRLVRNSLNAGFAEGNNQGATLSRGRYLLLLGSDTTVPDGALETLVDFMDRTADAGAAACRLVYPDGSLQRSCKRFPTVWNALATYTSLHILNRRYRMTDFDHASLRVVQQPDGTCFIMRRKVYEATGLFDTRYTILYNDVDLCQRIGKAGWKIYFTPEATVTHLGSQSTRKATPAVRLEMYRNILRYYDSYHGKFARLLLLPILLVRLLAVTKSATAFRLLRPYEEKVRL